MVDLESNTVCLASAPIRLTLSYKAPSIQLNISYRPIQTIPGFFRLVMTVDTLQNLSIMLQAVARVMADGRLSMPAMTQIILTKTGYQTFSITTGQSR